MGDRKLTLTSKFGQAVFADLFLSATTAVLLMFAAPFLHQVFGSPTVHPGFLPCWLVLFTVPFIVRTARNPRVPE